MGSWSPLHKRSVSMISGKPAKSLRIEPKQGGKIVEVGQTQSNWEAFGELAEMMRSGYGSGWVIIFEQAVKSACGG